MPSRQLAGVGPAGGVHRRVLYGGWENVCKHFAYLAYLAKKDHLPNGLRLSLLSPDLSHSTDV
jgi:hypothetical protein